MTQDIDLTRRAANDHAAQSLDDALRSGLFPEPATALEDEKHG
jgi:hypothetical protein